MSRVLTDLLLFAVLLAVVGQAYDNPALVVIGFLLGVVAMFVRILAVVEDNLGAEPSPDGEGASTESGS